jgi:hypothetical protein
MTPATIATGHEYGGALYAGARRDQHRKGTCSCGWVGLPQRGRGAVSRAEDDWRRHVVRAWEAMPVEPEDKRRANLTPGGKSLSGGGEISPVLQVRLPKDARARLHEKAQAAGVSDSKYARGVLLRDLDGGGS